MLGAILGDIIGSPYEFGERISPFSFDLFTEKSRMTDDSIMTLAIAQALIDCEEKTGKFRVNAIRRMQEFGRLYPKVGYGNRFKHWLSDPKAEPYESWGNGTVMRVSPIAWVLPSLEEVRALADASSRLSHIDESAARAAQALASMIFLARNGSPKEEIVSFVKDTFLYDCSEEHFNRLIQEAWENPNLSLQAERTVKLALYSFLCATNYEETVRFAVSFSPDTDTSAAVAGSIAEAYFGIPFQIRRMGLTKLDDRALTVYNRFLMMLNKEGGI